MKIPPLVPPDDQCPPLDYWGLDFCYEVVRQLLDEVVFTWRNKTIANLHEPSQGPYADDAYADEVYWYGFKNMACSQVAAGALAPLVETLYYRAASRFRGVFYDSNSKQSHHRWKLTDDFWNPSKLRQEEDGSTVTNIVGGFRQLMKALGHDKSLSRSSWDVIDALFAYRNASLHNGYIWPNERTNKLARMIEDRNWDKWFFVGNPKENDTDALPRPIWMKDEFVRDVLKEVPTVALSLRNVCISLAGRPPSAE